MSDKLRDLYAVKRSPVSPLANLLSLKQSHDKSLKQYVTELRIAAYRTMKDTTEDKKEEYLVTAFLKGMMDKHHATAIETLKPRSLDEAFTLAKKEVKYAGDANHIRAIQTEDFTERAPAEAPTNLRAMMNQLSLLQRQMNYLIDLVQKQTRGSPRYQPHQSYATAAAQNKGVVEKSPPVPRPVGPTRMEYRKQTPDQGTRPGLRTRAIPQWPIQCSNCNQLGHIARECPERAGCRRCGGRDHQARDCSTVFQRRREPYFRGIQKQDKEEFTADTVGEASETASQTSFTTQAPQEMETGCYMLSVQTQSTMRTHRQKCPMKTPTEEQRQVEAWVTYIEGRGGRPKRSTPTLISESRPESANKPLIRGIYEGHETKLFLDSDAEVNVIDQEYFRKLNEFTGGKIPFKAAVGSIACANGSRIQTVGTACITVTVENSKARVSFTVASNIFPKVIIGIRGMKTLDIQLDPANDQALAGGAVTVPFISKVTPQSLWSGKEFGPAQGVRERPGVPKRLH